MKPAGSVGFIEVDAAIEFLRRYAPMGVARPERIASMFVAREGRPLAWKTAEQLDALAEAVAANREQVMRLLRDEHWHFDLSQPSRSLEEWMGAVRAALWIAVLRSDPEELPEEASGGDAGPDRPEGSGSREPRRPIPPAGSMQATAQPPPPETKTDAIARAA